VKFLSRDEAFVFMIRFQVEDESTLQERRLSTAPRVQALETHIPTKPGELAFKKGDIIIVLGRSSRPWWEDGRSGPFWDGKLDEKTGHFAVQSVVSASMVLPHICDSTPFLLEIHLSWLAELCTIST
jgi:hypothetical protein